MQVDEDAGALAKSATVDLNRLFDGIQFQEVEELGLAGAQPLSSVRPWPFASTNPCGQAGLWMAQSVPGTADREVRVEGGPCNPQCQHECSSQLHAGQACGLHIRLRWQGAECATQPHGDSHIFVANS